ncbi:MAG: hypothetical protein WEB87_00890, partial [Bacteriovoracaceae bacterium]
MNFDDLKAAEPSFKIKKGEASKLKIQTISTPKALARNSCVFIKNNKFLNALLDAEVPEEVCLVAPESFYDSLEKEKLAALESAAAWLASVDSVELAMCSLSRPFYEQKFKGLNTFVDGRQMGTADVDPDAEIAQNVFIGEGCVIEEGAVVMSGCALMPKTRVGAGTVLFPNVTLYPFTQIGKQCRIHSQTVIGADGFGYNFVGGEHKKIWHFGGVVIEDNVEIGACSTVDAGSFTPTFIGSGTKLDNFCQIGHNCSVGRHCVLCGRAGL